MKEHIARLENIAKHPAYLDTDDATALRAAIDLMRAAEPKDEAAEAEFCVRELGSVGGDQEDVDWLIGLRAAARADGYKEGFDQGYMGGYGSMAAQNIAGSIPADLATELVDVKAQLTALRAQAECWRMVLVDVETDIDAALEAPK